MLVRQLKLASRLGVNQVTLTAGEGISEFPEIHRVCRYYGYATWFDYLADMVAMIAENPMGRPLVPVLDVGAVGFVELQKMRRHLAALRLMIDSADDGLQYRAAHRLAPHKTLQARLAALETAGRLGVPVVTGIVVGLGERPESWVQAAQGVLRLQEQYHHVQEFVLMPFEPVARTPMELYPAPTDEMFLQACRDVKRVLEGNVPVAAEIAGRLDVIESLIETGVRDLGEMRLASSDHVDTELPGALDKVGAKLAAKGWRLRPRQTLVNGMLRRGMLSPIVMDLLRRQREFAPQTASTGNESASAL
jgi:FO synthase